MCGEWEWERELSWHTQHSLPAKRGTNVHCYSAPGLCLSSQQVCSEDYREREAFPSFFFLICFCCLLPLLAAKKRRESTRRAVKSKSIGQQLHTIHPSRRQNNTDSHALSTLSSKP
jgi:hypothetical protein